MKRVQIILKVIKKYYKNQNILQIGDIFFLMLIKFQPDYKVRIQFNRSCIYLYYKSLFVIRKLMINNRLNPALNIILGQYPAKSYFQISSIFTICTLILIYWISQYYGHDKPFPHSWISDIAGHYPTATISGSTLLILGWFTNHFYIQTLAANKVINIHKFKPFIMLVIGITGAFCLMGSTANIDTGKKDGHWHTFCAGWFFKLTLLAQLYNTVIFSVLYFKYKAVSKYLTYAKLVHIVLLLSQLYVATTNNFFQNYGRKIQEDDLESDKDVILEWTLTMTILFGFLVMSLDVAKFKFVYLKNDHQNKQNYSQQIQLTSN